MIHARLMLVLAGIAPAALAQPTINITADVTSVGFGSTINWTVSVTGLTNSSFLQAYDFNLEASCDIGAASSFTTALSPLVNPTPGTPSGSSILAVSGGQSTLIDPLNTTFGDVVLGTFSVVSESTSGRLSYALTDGGVLGAPIIRTRFGSDLGPIMFEGLPDVRSDEVRIAFGDDCIPAPGAAITLACAVPLATRRRRPR